MRHSYDASFRPLSHVNGSKTTSYRAVPVDLQAAGGA
jgi:hypothetical protein